MINRHPWGAESTSFETLTPGRRPLYEDANLRVYELFHPHGRGLQGYEIAVYRARENWWYWLALTPDQAKRLMTALKSGVLFE